METRAHLFQGCLRILAIMQAKIFLFEIVVGLASMQKGNYLAHF
ncbi:hypothetical protein [Helicobacter labacensis]